MASTETPTQKHTRLALKFLQDAKQEIAAGELVQGSEKLWGATSQALKAYCASRGMPHSKYAQRRRAALQLADEYDDASIRSGFSIALSCHANFYNDWMEPEDLDLCLPDIETLVNKLLDARVEQP